MAEFKRGLGRGFSAKGLNALIDTETEQENTEKSGVIEVDIMKVAPNRQQPRKSFDKESLEELAESIKQVGIIQPLVVTSDGDFYEIVAGERRYRAARLAGIDKVPVIIREYSELEALQTALIENVQREDLNPVEEALTYKRFNEEFSLSQEDIAKKVGKNRSTVSNSMRLLNLDERVLQLLKENKLSSGHGKALLSLEDKELQYALAEKIVAEGLSVRKAEELVKTPTEIKEKPEKQPKENNSIYAYAEKELRTILGADVTIKAKGKKRRVEIEFYSDDEVDGFLSLMKKSVNYGG